MASDEGAVRRRSRRRWPVVLGVVVLLAVGLLGGGGWYFAGQIGAEALQPPSGAQPQRYDLVVASVSGGGVVLRRTSGHPDPDPLSSGGRFGLVWSGGAGEVLLTSAGAGKAAGTSTRVGGAGTWPQPGTPVALTDAVWTDPRAAYGLGYQDVTVPCAGGGCPAWFVPGQSTTWFVAVHGKGSSRAEGLRAYDAARGLGLPGLLVDYRNDPGAPADPSGRYRYGASEWHDLEAAVGYARRHGAQRVVLYGASMGGAVVAAFLEHSDEASVVSGVVLDAPALDLRAAVALGAAQRTLPVVGTGIPGVLTSVAEQIAGWRYGVDWHAVDYLPGDWLHVPALVFHGTADTTVPIATSDALQRAHPGLVEEDRVAGAAHVGSWNADWSDYEWRESGFLSCVLAGGARCPGAGVQEIHPAA